MLRSKQLSQFMFKATIELPCTLTAAAVATAESKTKTCENNKNKNKWVNMQRNTISLNIKRPPNEFLKFVLFWVFLSSVSICRIWSESVCLSDCCFSFVCHWYIFSSEHDIASDLKACDKNHKHGMLPHTAANNPMPKKCANKPIIVMINNKTRDTRWKPSGASEKRCDKQERDDQKQHRARWNGKCET